MDTYLILVVVLFALAIFDLVVGVSNDAVNFLNSSIGSKVAKRHVIMIVASVGIFLGAVLSDGMMEVARKGVFHPEAFVFEDMMVIFFAVMVTDIILLDLFNTFGMPTSTTVSIVFELLGSAVMVSLIKMTSMDQGLSHMSDYINWANAGKIISGILLSVLIAFTVGAIVMYISRLLFSFEYKKKLRFVAPVWGGLALTAMTYFLFVKGLKHASFLTKEMSTFIKEEVVLVLAVSFVAWSIILLLVSNLTKINVLKFVVLFGTFSLAMAFAGNDLVNFIGVPVAGLKSFEHWDAMGRPDGLGMEFLAEKVPTEWYYLFIAGGVMVVTLWLSKKARSVTETEVKLGRQDEGQERFRPNMFSRGVVNASRSINKIFIAVLPAGLQTRINKAFEPIAEEPSADGEEGPAFDLIRASVNLAVASMIISYASGQKLPLSTTYVSFMVAMGASLADRAWGRDSAVYRIAGVVNVVLGWFGTALIAFTASATFAFLIYHYEIYAIAGLLLLAIGLVFRSTLVHRRRESKKALKDAAELKRGELEPNTVKAEVRKKVVATLKTVRTTVTGAVDGLVSEDKDKLRKVRKDMAFLAEENEAFRMSLYHYLKRIKEDETEAGRMYLKTYDHEQDLVQSTNFIAESCLDHVLNVHSPLKTEQTERLQRVKSEVDTYLGNVIAALENTPISADTLQKVVVEKNALLKSIEEGLAQQTEGIRDEVYNSRNSLLSFSIAFEMKDLVAVTTRFVKMFHRAGE